MAVSESANVKSASEKPLLQTVLFIALFGLFADPAISLDNASDCRKDGETLVMGVRTDAPPFAWQLQQDRAGSAETRQPRFTGYSAELCELIAKRTLQEGLFEESCMEPVTAQDRFRKLAKGEIHLLCGASSVTLARMETVDFSLFTFLSGASVLYNAQTSGPSVRIGFLRGTTTEDEVSRIGGSFYHRSNRPPNAATHIERIPFETHDTAVTAIIEGKIDAYLADREILLAIQQRVRQKLREQPEQASAAVSARAIKVSEQYFTFEPYAIGVTQDRRKLRIIANKVLTELFSWKTGSSGGQGIATVLTRYFPRKTFSRSLETLFKVQRIPLGTPIDLADQD